MFLFVTLWKRGVMEGSCHQCGDMFEMLSCVITSSESVCACGPWRCTSAGFTCFSVFLQTLHHIRDLFGLKHVCVCYSCQPQQLLSVGNMPNIQIYVKLCEL